MASRTDASRGTWFWSAAALFTNALAAILLVDVLYKYGYIAPSFKSPDSVMWAKGWVAMFAVTHLSMQIAAVTKRAASNYKDDFIDQFASWAPIITAISWTVNMSQNHGSIFAFWWESTTFQLWLFWIVLLSSVSGFILSRFIIARIRYLTNEFSMTR